MNTLHRRYAWAAPLRGTATISGVVKELTTPVANRAVYLMEQENLRPVRETRSASDGTYSFTNIATNQQWVLMAIDYTGAYNAVVADRVMT